METWLELVQREPDAAAVILSATATLATVVLAFFGFLVNHISSVRRHQLEARLAFVTEQLAKLYGPLYALVQSNTAAFNAFRQTFRPNAPLFDRTKPFTDEERVIWRTWAENVFIPSNIKIRDVIEHSGHLMLDGRMPPVFEAMLAHVESSKLVLPSLAGGDPVALERFPPWPNDFNTFVADSYFAVVREHDRLLGRARRRKKSNVRTDRKPS